MDGQIGEQIGEIGEFSNLAETFSNLKFEEAFQPYFGGENKRSSLVFMVERSVFNGPRTQIGEIGEFSNLNVWIAKLEIKWEKLENSPI